MAIVGFDAGGPLSFSTIGRQEDREFVTYISCELAVREEQVPSGHGRFELMCHSNDQSWVRKVLSKIGEMSLEAQFDHGHTVDFSEILGPDSNLTGVLLERYLVTEIEGKEYSIFRVHGITKEEMRFAFDQGEEPLFTMLKKEGVYPHTDIHRRTVG
jgi:hypothetical protein